MTLQAADIAEADEEELTREIETEVKEWSSNSNECLILQLVRGDGTIAAQMSPEFTHAMFGQEEAIFGYQNLAITLSFRAHDLSPQLDIRYGSIFEAQGDVQPTDIAEALRPFLPESAFKQQPQHDDALRFEPPGEKLHEYRRRNNGYETWCASLADPRAREMLENMQILAPMFIDGGSMLELEQDWTTQRWKVFLVYEVDHSVHDKVAPYTLIGYGTSYRAFTFPERQNTVQWDVFSPNSHSLEDFLPAPEGQTNELSKPSDLPSPLHLPARERLSQFLILPPWHGSGHGHELYNTMYKHLITSHNVREFTVEDPNEKFDDLRDFADLLHLRAHVPEFVQLRIKTDIPADKLNSPISLPADLIVPLDIRKQVMRDTKIMPRQFDRLVEMHTLSFIPPRHRSRNRITKKEKASGEHDKAYYFWRLYVKHRLFIFNRDQLSQVEHAERVAKLESAVDSVLEAYTEIIDRVEAREKANASGGLGAEEKAKVNPSAVKRKRYVVGSDDDENEETGAQDEAFQTVPNSHKKNRIE